MEKFDIAIIGGGPAGYVCAIRAAQLGYSVCCIEKGKTLGGTCLNIGCIPSKSLLHTSHLFKQSSNLESFGISFSGLAFDLSQIMKTKEASVESLTKGVDFLFKKNKIKHKQGFAKFIDSNQIQILSENGDEIISADKIVIATGSVATSPENIVIDEKDVLSSTGALSLSSVPDHLIIVGAGYIGLELGSVWSRFGAKVTVIEYQDRILPGMDKEIANSFQKILIKQGFEFRLSTSLKTITKKEEKLSVQVENAGQSIDIDCDKVLVATGRKPYTFGLDLSLIHI